MTCINILVANEYPTMKSLRLEGSLQSQNPMHINSKRKLQKSSLNFKSLTKMIRKRRQVSTIEIVAKFVMWILDTRQN